MTSTTIPIASTNFPIQLDGEESIYGVEITAPNGDSFHSQIVTIEYRDAVLEVEVSVVAIIGTVRRGDEPVTGSLRLAAAEGHEHARFVLDQEGRFEGVLPSAGTWWPEVEIGGETALALVLDAVEVDPSDPSEPVVLALEVPDTRLSGQVVDGDGEPVADAAITVRNGSHLGGRHGHGAPSGLLRSAADGTFSIRGLVPGPLTLGARRGPAVSAEHYVTLVESEPGAPLRLVLEEKVVWAGLVQSGGQPLAGARIAVWSDRRFPGGGYSTDISVEDTVSRDDGVFEFSLPADVKSAVVLAGAPGLATQLFRASNLERQRLLISLAPGGGRLHIPGGGPRGLAGLWLEHQGIVVPSFFLLERFVPGFNPRRPVSTLSDLASGEYALCRRSPGGSEPTCERAFLPPGGEVTFSGADSSDDRAPASDRTTSDERRLDG